MGYRTVKPCNKPSAWPRVAGASVLLCASCTLMIDADAEQCATREDCSQFAGTICIDGACVVPEPGTPGECRTHDDCDQRHGDHWICRRSDEICVPLLSEHCQTIFGDYTDDHAIFIGSLLQIDGDYASTGISVENAIRLAFKDFEQANNGLPPAPGQTAHRPLVLVGCNAGVAPIAAARHLADVVQVPAIIGASFSGTTIQVATEVTIPSGVLLLSPSATSAAITDLQDDNLVWRTSPSDVLQALAIQQLVAFVEADVRESLSLGDATPIRLAVVNKGDSYGRGLANAVEAGLVFNGKSLEENREDYARFDYGDPSNPGSVAYEGTVKKLLDHAPHIVFIFGTTEAVTEVLGPFEQVWSDLVPDPGHRPRYILSDGGIVHELWELVGHDDQLRRRILGTVPGTRGALFDAFRRGYIGLFGKTPSPDVFGAAGGYDAVHLIGYAIASLRSAEVTGPKLVSGLASLAPPGVKVEVGLEAINKAFGFIAQGESLDFEGASGPLDFDVTTGEARSDIQIWCLPTDENNAATAAEHSGWYLDAATDKLTDRPETLCE